MNIEEMAILAKTAKAAMAIASTNQKNTALKIIKENLKKHEKKIFQANLKDIDQAKSAGLNQALIDRLSIQNKLDAIISDIEQIIELPDPIGECFEESTHDKLEIKKYRTPLGVLGIIYESRPNVTIDVSVLAIKSGNCAILRGGSETLHTNKILVSIIQESIASIFLPENAIQLVSSPDRNEVQTMLLLDSYIDVIIPRGGAKLHKFCRENSTIPVITGGIGICHLFVDESANLEKSLKVILNAKTQRPTVCNALDTLLIHEKIVAQFIPQVIGFLKPFGVHFHLDPKAMKIMQDKGFNDCISLAGPYDFDTEWLSLNLGIKVVKNMDEAIQHIFIHGSGHSDGILTENKKNADQFITLIDSAAVYVNASTRFTDGGQLGLGSEVAVSTQKLHARGPMGLKELTSYKWVIRGDYATRN
jgi:glutamate-5-semialdehyde dehydrogenase